MRNLLIAFLMVGMWLNAINSYSQTCSPTPAIEAVRNGDFESGYLTGSGTVHNFTANGPFDFRSDLNFAGAYNPAGPCNYSMMNTYAVVKSETKPACGGPNTQFGNGYVLPGTY